MTNPEVKELQALTPDEILQTNGGGFWTDLGRAVGSFVGEYLNFRDDFQNSSDSWGLRGLK